MPLVKPSIVQMKVAKYLLNPPPFQKCTECSHSYIKRWIAESGSISKPTDYIKILNNGLSLLW